MIPIPSLGLASFIGTVLVVLVALAPALVVWWRDRGLLARQDDPALPELIANRRRASVGVLAVALAFLLVFAGGAAAWAIPLLIAALAAAEYPIRTRILGEEWSFARYLWHSVLTLVGSAGFWIALAFVPVVVLRVAAAIGRERVPWIVMFAAIFAAVLLAWETWYPRLWLWTQAAEPLTDPELTARFDEVVRRSGTTAPAVYRVDANGSRFM